MHESPPLMLYDAVAMTYDKIKKSDTQKMIFLTGWEGCQWAAFGSRTATNQGPAVMLPPFSAVSKCHISHYTEKMMRHVDWA